MLAGLARARPDYTQTVLDVLCAYLRRPFSHPGYQSNPADPGRAEVAPSDERWTEEHGVADRERQVRATAQRPINELLPASDDPEPKSYDLDVTGAALEFFNLSKRHLGQLTARRAHFYGITRLDNLRADQIMLFSGARFAGRLDLSFSWSAGGLSLFETQLHDEFRMINTVVHRLLDVRAAAPDRAGRHPHPRRGHQTETRNPRRLAPPARPRGLTHFAYAASLTWHTS